MPHVVYVVVGVDWEDFEVVAVFWSKEQAEAEARRLTEGGAMDYHVEEHEVKERP